MKKACLGFVIIYMLGLAACGFSMEEISFLPNLTEREDVTEAPVATETPGVTEVQEVTPEVQPTATLESEPTAVPVAATEKPAATAGLTATQVPTATSKPTAIATSKPKSGTSEINRLLKLGKTYPNTVVRGEVCTSEKEANEFFREKTLTYSSFAIIVDKAEYLHSAEEYMTMYPEIKSLTIEKIDRYDNGYCAVFQDVEMVDDANLCYAVRTGNLKVLSETEREILSYLESVLEKTGARQQGTVEAVKVLHDYLVLELKYDESFQKISHSPEGVMKNKTAVCDGYSRTMQLLLFMLDIESRIISGTAGEQSHAWNLVKIGDDWYHVDVTWDDPVPDVKGKVGYLYFLKNDAYMAKTHTWKSDITCTANEYQVYMYRDVLCESYDDIRAVYSKQIGNKEYLTFCYPKSGEVNRDLILDFVMKELQMGLTYYPEKELTDYKLLEIVNPLLEK